MATSTPNIGLQVPNFNQPNWQTPLNFDLNRLDLIFGGAIQVPALNVADLITNVAATIASVLVTEQPAGSVPGSVFTLSQTPGVILGFYVNGILQRPGSLLDYTVSGVTVTLARSTSSGDTVYAVYLHA